MNSESGEAHEKNKTNHSSDEVPPIPSDTSSIANVPPRDANNDTTNQPDWQRRHYRMQVALFIVGLIVMLIYGGQLYEMQQAAKLQTNALHIDQRAWVATIGVTGDLAVGQPFVSRVRFKNTGKTFARNTRARVLAEIVKKGSAPHFDRVFDSLKEGQTFSEHLLAPNADAEGYDDPLENSPFSEEQIANIRDNQDLFVYGRITYTDVFHRDHWTTFCFRYNVKSGNYEYYERYNDADN